MSKKAIIRLSPWGEVGAAETVGNKAQNHVPRRVRGSSAGATIKASPLTLTLSPWGEGNRVGPRGLSKNTQELQPDQSTGCKLNRTAVGQAR